MSEDPDRGSVARGVGTAILLHFWQLLIIPLFTLLPLAGLAWLGWSLTQFLYLWPAYLGRHRKGEKETAKGILLVGGLGILLNGACDAILFVR